METLGKQLSNWDGKDKDEIHRIYRQFANRKNLFTQLIVLLSDQQSERGVTWLIKHHLEKGHLPSQSDTVTIIQQLPLLQHWESRLHLLQSLRYFTLPESEKRSLEVFVRKGLSDPNKFVRAWSYDGFFQLARQFPEYRPVVTELFDMAIKDEPASVKARIRNLLKEGV
ncbi:hypothetical protein NF212_21595 [Parasalinivibrio latis]|uniref:hypothetical protein n=1 Tax=Parasalinivibrio latis TaxID=2952610 RepID=UPI0030E57532